MKKLTIARLAEGAGVGVETVRFYQRRGLMPVPATQGAGPYRTYDETHLERLRLIRRAQAAGFRLEEIRELVTADPLADRRRVLDLASARLEALKVQQAQLQAVGQALERLITACRNSTAAPCPIITAFAPPSSSHD
jgi:MerR family transcriptional regulator, mercuric resistance operon regulatory protein